jgi:hypothetical protein
MSQLIINNVICIPSSIATLFSQREKWQLCNTSTTQNLLTDVDIKSFTMKTNLYLCHNFLFFCNLCLQLIDKLFVCRPVGWDTSDLSSGGIQMESWPQYHIFWQFYFSWYSSLPSKFRKYLERDHSDFLPVVFNSQYAILPQNMTTINILCCKRSVI